MSYEAKNRVSMPAVAGNWTHVRLLPWAAVFYHSPMTTGQLLFHLILSKFVIPRQDLLSKVLLHHPHTLTHSLQTSVVVRRWWFVPVSPLFSPSHLAAPQHDHTPAPQTCEGCMCEGVCMRGVCVRVYVWGCMCEGCMCEGCMCEYVSTFMLHCYTLSLSPSLSTLSSHTPTPYAPSSSSPCCMLASNAHGPPPLLFSLPSPPPPPPLPSPLFSCSTPTVKHWPPGHVCFPVHTVHLPLFSSPPTTLLSFPPSPSPPSLSLPLPYLQLSSHCRALASSAFLSANKSKTSLWTIASSASVMRRRVRISSVDTPAVVCEGGECGGVRCEGVCVWEQNVSNTHEWKVCQARVLSSPWSLVDTNYCQIRLSLTH